jgi:hypothetical protein
MKIAILLIMAIVSIGTSFYIGFKIGAEQYYLGSAQYRMMTHYGYLKSANKNNLKGIQDQANSQIDYELITHVKWLDSKWQWMLPAMQIDNDKYGNAVAQYRFSNPYEHKPLDLTKFPIEERSQMKEREAEIQNDIQQAYERYRH